MSSFWYLADTMPMQPPLVELPRDRSVVPLPFWDDRADFRKDWDADFEEAGFEEADSEKKEPKKSVELPSLEIGVPSERFFEFTVSYLSNPLTDTTRVHVYDELSQIALELVMRDMHLYANVCADAMFDTAVMYR